MVLSSHGLQDMAYIPLSVHLHCLDHAVLRMMCGLIMRNDLHYAAYMLLTCASAGTESVCVCVFGCLPWLERT